MILNCDGYKLDHRRQYPKGTKLVYSNWTPRKSRIPGIEKVVLFGLQYFVREYLINKFNKEFFEQDKEKVLHSYKRRINAYLGPDHGITLEHISDLHDLGYLPIRIYAIPEGTATDIKVPQVVIYNSMDEFFWLVNYLETIMSNVLWMPCTSATIARKYKQLFEKWADKTYDGVDKDFLTSIQGHDFSMRGMPGLEAAQMSSAGHLLSFVGTDTVPAIDFLEQNYDCDADTEMIAISVPATEHSVMCAGAKDGEFETFKRLITETYPSGIVSIVADTWDLWKVLTDYLPRLKTEILARDGKVIIRPDSGDPADIICGKVNNSFSTIKEIGYFLSEVFWEKQQGKYYFSFENDIYSVEFATLNEFALEYGTEQMFEFGDKTTIYDLISGGRYSYIDKENISVNESKGVVELLWDAFGGTVNSKGYKVLDPHIGCIYGDSITIDRAEDICSRLDWKGFASINWVAGIGSFTYQYNTRDTFGFAMKATYVEIEHTGAHGKGVEKRAIFKDPITDDGTKTSAKGLLAVRDGKLYDELDWSGTEDTDFELVFSNGSLVRRHSLNEIRENLCSVDLTKFKN